MPRSDARVVPLLVEVLDGFNRLGIHGEGATAVVERALRKAGMRPELLDEALATLATQGRA